MDGKFCLEAWTISRVSSYVCSVTGIFRNLQRIEVFDDDSDYQKKKMTTSVGKPLVT